MINVIFAMTTNGIIGIGNKLPWKKQRGDMLYFKILTTNNIVIMGRKTFESIGSKPLPNRLNIVVSRTLDSTNDENLLVFTDLVKAINFSKTYDEKDIFVIGGKEIYQQCIDMGIVDNIYMTEILMTPDVHNKENIFKPNWTNYELIYTSDVYPSDNKNEFPYQFIKYKKELI